MKKSTKSLWIYAAVLFIIAIGLICSATILQARLISSDGDIWVLGTFTQNANQNIENLTNENIRLSGELDAVTKSNQELKTKYDELKAQRDKDDQTRELLKQIYTAYDSKDYDALAPLLEKITQEEADMFLPGFYETASNALNSIKKN